MWDAKASRRLRKTFPTRSAAKRWRHDAIVALRSGELSGVCGLLLSEVIEQWLDDLRKGISQTALATHTSRLRSATMSGT